MKDTSRFIFFLTLIFSSSTLLFSQEIPFQKEVKSLTERIDQKGWKPNSFVFTGSSSVRLWRNLQEEFPTIPIINTGFGGSQASDLLIHLDELVIRYGPEKVFIYEGDNDISAGKEATQIMTDIDLLVNRILQKLPETTIVLISAKPSPSRWQLKTSYTVLNDLMRQYATTHNQVDFMNVWDVMLDKTGKPISEIFIADSLHMNEKGYAIWNKSVIPFMK
ncbi:GDSL-type esterase/lipase family protein [Algoriphagus marinus]|uniref:GDSL-type esterase/lipase family protein n=1 Tax=Algoriphagus marinus TaxID=1925762 RepID=UPI00094B94A6|nr:GDSL-type esterase/lipase family protein [Algoriphagus marinus]